MTVATAEQSKSVLAIFWELSSTQEKTRTAAIDALVTALSASQARFLDTKPESYTHALATYQAWSREPLPSDVPSSSKSEESEESAKSTPALLAQTLPIDAVVSTDLSYSLKRLALIALLLAFPIVSIKLVLQLIGTMLTPTGNNIKGPEETDHLVGKLCGWTCVYQWLRCLRSASLGPSSLSLLGPHLIVMFGDMIDHLTKKSYLREGLGLLLTDLYCLLETDLPELAPSLAQLILTMLQKENSSVTLYNAEVLALTLLIDSQKNGPLLLEKCNWSLEKIKTVIAESHYSHPRMHVIWQVMLAQLLAARQPIATVFGLDLKAFWKTFVDELLFHSTSHEKKYLGFLLFEKALVLFAQDTRLVVPVAILFSPHFVRVLSHSVTHPKNLLFKAGSLVFEAIVRASESRSDLALALMDQLIRIRHLFTGPPLVRQTLERLVRLLNAIDLTQLEKALELRVIQQQQPVATAATDPKYIALNRQYYLDTLLHLLVKKSTTLSIKGIELESLLKSIVQFMISLVNPASSLPQSTLEMVHGRFISLLGDLACLDSFAKSTLPLSIPGLLSNGMHWFSYVLTLFQRPSSNATLDICFKLLDRIAAISNEKTQTDARQLKAFELLTSGLALQLLLAPEVEQSVMETDADTEISSSLPAILTEVSNCFDKLFLARPEKTKKRKLTEQEQEQEQASSSSDLAPIEVLTDLLLSLLAKPETFYRSICQRVFYLLRDLMNENAYALILQALDQDEGEDELSESCESEASENELQADESMQSETRSESELDDNDSLPDLTDEQMVHYDEKLASVFVGKQRQLKVSKMTISTKYHFKHKVLALLDECLRGSDPLSPLLLDLIVPLCELASHTRMLAGSESEKKAAVAWGSHIRHWLSNRLFQSKNLPPLLLSTPQSLEGTLDFLVARLTRASEMEMSLRSQREEEKTLTLGFVFVARVLAQSCKEGDAAAAASTMLKPRLDKLLASSFGSKGEGRKSPCPSPKFYEDWMARFPMLNCSLLLPALTCTLSSSTSSNAHHQLALSELLTKIFKSNMPSSDLSTPNTIEAIDGLVQTILSKLKESSNATKALHASWLGCLSAAIKKQGLNTVAMRRCLEAVDDLRQHWQATHRPKSLVDALDRLKLKLKLKPDMHE